MKQTAAKQRVKDGKEEPDLLAWRRRDELRRGSRSRGIALTNRVPRRAKHRSRAFETA